MGVEHPLSLSLSFLVLWFLFCLNLCIFLAVTAGLSNIVFVGRATVCWKTDSGCGYMYIPPPTIRGSSYLFSSRFVDLWFVDCSLLLRLDFQLASSPVLLFSVPCLSGHDLLLLLYL